MSKMLAKATEQFRAGQFKKAADTLWEVTFVGNDYHAEAQAMLTLATQLRDVSDGGVRTDCEEHIARAQRYLTSGENDPANREAALRRDPVGLARLAREAGLTWLTVDSEVNLTAAPLQAVLADAASPPPACILDSVEAEGWRLVCVTRAFQPVNNWVWGSPDKIAQGVFRVEEKYQYMFKRRREVSG
jgi:hypothetical protein